ncbi:MAG: hypothetical protein QOI54_1344 [Actinomycetota bacterium]|jgi:hypothetical protein|nr:hypothetical protein [Actinomycetota bacterium]
MSTSTRSRLLPGSGRPVIRSGSTLCTVLALVLQMLVVGVLAAASPAAAAGRPAATVDPVGGFPSWYEDSAGNRVEQCIDPNDPNCVVVASDTFDPTRPTVFPTNYPDEFFYALADSDIVQTAGCLGTAPGKATVRLALEGAFVNGAPAAGDQMVFGRIRVKVTSGLCPNTTYHFRHPFGTASLTTNAAGAIPANVGTEDIGCVPVAPSRCNFAQAGSSRVFGTAADGFLRWNPAVAPAAPQGYLGDAVTPHTIVGGTAGNAFAILDSGNHDLGLTTDQFTVAGKTAGSLSGDPSPFDFGGQTVLTTSPAKTLTVTNLDKAPVTIGALTMTGDAAAAFSAVPGATNGCTPALVLGRDATCTVDLTYTPAVAGRVTAALEVSSTGGVRSPLRVDVTGRGINVGDAPSIEFTPAPPAALAFPATRVRTTSAPKTLTIGNTGQAPLKINKVFLDGSNGSGSSHYLVTRDTCSGKFVDPGAACQVDVIFVPSVAGDHATRLVVESNDQGSPHFVNVTGTGTGGFAAVAPDAAGTSDGFPGWYRDENGVKLDQCIDPQDPNCVVLPDDFFNPAQPLVFPTNFPEEFFYTVADSDIITTPGCNGSAPGKAFMRSAVEGAFTGAGPIPGDQMTFGRIRFAVTGGLCPNTTYTFTHPYGESTFTTNASGGLARARATDDVGCAPVAPDVCDFSEALSSRVFGGFLRWDPAVAPAAPAGYIGDATTLHSVVGAPYKPDGVHPANFFKITQANGDTVGETNQFTVMGKLRGPLEPSTKSLELPSTAVSSTSGNRPVTFTNTGIEPLTVNTLAISGVDAGDFNVAPGTCPGLTLGVGDSCTAQVSFSPTAVGDRDATLTVHHTGLNDPVLVALHGIGGAVGATPAISFTPRSATFVPLHVGKVSAPQTISVSNAGGNAALDVGAVSLGGANASSFSILHDSCSGTSLGSGEVCKVDVVFAPASAGSLTADLVVQDNAPGGTHTVALTGVGSNADPAVSATHDGDNGFPHWYQDSNGVRVGQCLDPADVNCIVLGDAGFNPASPTVFPTNFPAEFFYSIADSDALPTTGCGGQTTPGTAQLRVALEGSFANGAPAAGEQTTFGRLRISVTRGLCPNADYIFVTPYGPVPFTTNAVGGLARNQGTQDVGCAPVAPATCDFSAALGSRIAQSFPRWDPAAAPAAPVGYLGSPTALHKIVGGTYVPAGADGPVNYAAITDLAGNIESTTDRFTVSGKLAGPLVSDKNTVDLGHAQVGQTGDAQTITVTNVATSPTTISGVALTGANAGEFAIGTDSCSSATKATDTTCAVSVSFAPHSAGAKTATLRITPATGPVLTVKLTGIGDAATAPAISVTPGVLSFGTVTAPATPSLSTTVKNTGTAALNIGAVTIAGAAAGDFSVTSAPCGSIAPAGTCLITVKFAPKAIGARTASLSIAHNATGTPTQVSLSGTGAGSTFTISPSPVTFGTVNRNTTKTQSVTVKNSGTIAFRVGSASITGAQAASFAVVNNGAGCVATTLAPGKTCSITVSLRPTAAIGYSASLVVAGDTTSLPTTVSAGLTGTGK